MKLKEIKDFLESLAPISYQEAYDNSGLQIGNPEMIVEKVLICLDITEQIIDEALENNCNLIISHHPIIFKGLKKITGTNYVERVVQKAIKYDVALYAIHTNLDNVLDNGVNQRLAQKLGLENINILDPKKNQLSKLIFYSPKNDVETILGALFKEGAGEIGSYKKCSYQNTGIGTFMPQDTANPRIGRRNVLSKIEETRAEVLIQNHQIQSLVEILKKEHPYEEVAYEIIELKNPNQDIGTGIIGKLPEEMSEKSFLNYLKEKLHLDTIKYTPLSKKIATVALVGGSGSNWLGLAKEKGADAFVSSDFKYHHFFDAESNILIADIGHYESEIHTIDLLSEIIQRQFPKFAVLLTKTNTNPIKYFK